MPQIALATLLSQHSPTVSINKLQIIIVQFLFLIFAAISFILRVSIVMKSILIIIIIYYINNSWDINFFI